MVSAIVSVEGAQQAELEAAIARDGTGPWTIPLVPLRSTITAVAGSTLTLDRLPVVPAAFQIGEAVVNVASTDGLNVTLASAAGTVGQRITPMVEAWLSETVPVERMLPGVASVQADFRLTHGLPGVAATLPLYRDLPVLELCHNWVAAPTYTLARNVVAVDNATGRPELFDHPGVPLPLRTYSVLTEDVADTGALLGLLYALRGAWRGIWVPSGGDDISIIGGSLSAIDAASIAVPLPATRRDLRLRHADGSTSYRRVVTTEAIAGGRRLHLDTALPSAAVQATFLSLSRLESDLARVNWWTAEQAETELAFKAYAHDL